ncbi:MAG: GNAT family N-acetyltransferase [Thermotogota bacterium]
MIIYQKDLNNISKNQLQGFFVGWSSPLTTTQHFKILENSQYFVLAVDQDTSQVIGFVNALSDHVNFAFIPMLEVLPNYQNKGIGTKLMATMLEQLSMITCVDLTCDQDLQDFYQRFSMLRSHGMILRKYIKNN